MLNEKFIADSKDPGSILWANGTTKKRYDIENNKFRSYLDDEGKVDYYNPLYFTNDMKYIFNYAKSHVVKDYGFKTNKAAGYDKAVDENAIIVFAKLKDGTQLFDFTDIEDFNKVFDENGQEIHSIFKNVEPYFAFNTNIINNKRDKVPIEFTIAQKIAIWLKSDKNRYKTINKKDEFGNGTKVIEIATSFFNGNNSFIGLFKNANDENIFDIQIDHQKYDEFYSFYMACASGAQEQISRTGRQQLKKGKNLIAILPKELTADQINKVNSYFKLLGWCIRYKTEVMKYEQIEKIIQNSTSEKVSGFIDLLQACLYLGMKKAGFKGFYCPEYKGSSNNLQAICIFDKNIIEKISHYSLSYVDEAIKWCKQHDLLSSKDILATIRDGIDIYPQMKKDYDDDQKRREEEALRKYNAAVEQRRKKEQEEKRKAQEEKRKAQEEKQKEIERRKAAGEFYVDENYISKVFNEYSKLVKNDPGLQLKAACKRWCNQHKDEFTRESPRMLIRRGISQLDNNEKQRRIKDIEMKMDYAIEHGYRDMVERLRKDLEYLRKHGVNSQITFNTSSFRTASPRKDDFMSRSSEFDKLDSLKEIEF